MLAAEIHPGATYSPVTDAEGLPYGDEIAAKLAYTVTAVEPPDEDGAVVATVKLADGTRDLVLFPPGVDHDLQPAT